MENLGDSDIKGIFLTFDSNILKHILTQLTFYS